MESLFKLPQIFDVFSSDGSFLINHVCVERRRHVRLPVHEAVHRRGDLPASTPQLIPPSAQQLLRPLGPVPPPGGLVTRAEPLRHLQRGFSPDEHQLPRPPQMPRLWSGLLFTLLSHHKRGLLLQKWHLGSLKDDRGHDTRHQFSFKKKIQFWYLNCEIDVSEKEVAYVQLWLWPEDFGNISFWSACGFLSRQRYF